MDLLITAMKEQQYGMVAFEDRKRFFEILPLSAPGAAIVTWLMAAQNIEDRPSARYLAHQLLESGYLIQLEVATVVEFEDSEETFYSYQSEAFWPSKYWLVDDTDFAVYLQRRTKADTAVVQLSKLEQDELDRLQKGMKLDVWANVVDLANQQNQYLQTLSKPDRKLLEMREHMFWRTHRPAVYQASLSKGAQQQQPREIGQPDPRIQRWTEQEFTENVLTPEKALAWSERQVSQLSHQLNKVRYTPSDAGRLLIKYTVLHQFQDPLVNGFEGNAWWQDEPPAGEAPSTSMVQPEQVNMAATYKLKDRVSLWTCGLKDVLADEEGVRQFYAYLAKKKCAEYLEFYQACAAFKQQPDVEKVRQIVGIHLTKDGEKEVAMPDKIRQALVHQVESGQVDPLMVDDAQRQVYQMLVSSHYPHFFQSQEVQQILHSQ